MNKSINISNFKEKILIFFLFIFSLLINQYYGNKGVFPLDSFSHFDPGYRILIGEYPFRDYWIIEGLIIDYLQSIFFYIFGVNWQSYILHASLINVILSIATFKVLKNFNLNIYYCFFYSISFSILAYPTSGTPFADHHSAFFSILGIYFLILGIKNNLKIYWFLFPIFFSFAFFSKQVPSSYIIIFISFILILYSIINKKFNWIKYSLFSSALFILILIIIGKIQGISFSSFMDQYIFYPRTLGAERYQDIEISFKNIFLNFKFIYISLLPLLFINLWKIFSESNYLRKSDFLYFLILFSLGLSLILHQLLTKNQIFIFFLIPIFLAFSHIALFNYRLKENFFIPLIILLCIFTTFKYHMRFNEDRKFHELSNINFNLSQPGNKIDKKFYGLEWISTEFRENPKKEIDLILEINSYLKKDERKKMLMTHYAFFSAILNQKLFSPTRYYTKHGVSHPTKDNRYFRKYQNFFIKKIKQNNISVIYTMKPLDRHFLNELLGDKCLKSSSLNSILDEHLILECDNLKMN
tara:strand:- start:565 stop:2142 length:1578 start_codon:yes stop_codon:yes gene_type:complete